jgi:hypothetical protein
MKMTSLSRFFLLGISLCALLFLVACSATKWQSMPPEQSHLEHDPLSYGAVVSRVQKGVTTQEEILRNFGPPNITTINRQGREVWMYDRISTASQSNNWSEARRFSVFFGLGVTEPSSMKDGGMRKSSTRTLTVIITFDKNKRVVDYSARATQF